MKRLPQLTGFDHHETPAAVYETLNAEFHFDHDPCPLHGDQSGDGLDRNKPWGATNYINPPYSNMRPWVQRAVDETALGHTSVMLLKCDPSTKMFHELILPFAREIRFFKGRITFPPSTVGAPFPSMVVVFRPGEPERHVCVCPEEKCSYCHN